MTQQDAERYRTTATLHRLNCRSAGSDADTLSHHHLLATSRAEKIVCAAPGDAAQSEQAHGMETLIKLPIRFLFTIICRSED